MAATTAAAAATSLKARKHKWHASKYVRWNARPDRAALERSFAPPVGASYIAVPPVAAKIVQIALHSGSCMTVNSRRRCIAICERERDGRAAIDYAQVHSYPFER